MAEKSSENLFVVGEAQSDRKIHLRSVPSLQPDLKVDFLVPNRGDCAYAVLNGKYLYDKQVFVLSRIHI